MRGVLLYNRSIRSNQCYMLLWQSQQNPMCENSIPITQRDQASLLCFHSVVGWRCAIVALGVCLALEGTRTFLRGEDSSNQPQFLIPAVSDPVPHLPETRILPSTIAEPETGGQQYSAEWIGCRAAANIPLADLMRGDLKADSSSIQKPNSKQRATLALRNRLQEFRIARQSQIAASQAMMIHYGLATLEALQSIQSETNEEIRLQQARQDKAIEMGVTILDPMALPRLLNSLHDQEIESLSKASQLRSQLTVLVGTRIACSYRPNAMTEPVCPPPFLDTCEYLNYALSHRCDLLGLVHLRNNLTVETLDVARWMSDVLTATPPATLTATSIPGISFIRLLLSQKHRDDDAELCERLKMLDEAIGTLRTQIASDVDIAVAKQRSAAERYCNAIERVQLWKTRIDQLRAYGEKIKPMLDEEASAQQNWLQSRSDAIQRQGDWHQAIVELGLAIGNIP